MVHAFGMQCSHPTQYPDVHPIYMYDLNLNCNVLFLSEKIFLPVGLKLLIAVIFNVK